MSRIHGTDAAEFVRRVVPLLDGSRTAAQIADAFTEYPREAVVGVLDLLARKGVTEELSVTPELEEESLWGQSEFLRAWTTAASDPAAALRRAAIVMVGLEPWGLVAAEQLASSGVGRLHLVDDRPVVAGDLVAMPALRGRVGQPRGAALASLLRERGGKTAVDAGAAVVLSDGALELPPPPDGSSWTWMLGAASRDDLRLTRALALAATRQRSVAVCMPRRPSRRAWTGGGPGETACWSVRASGNSRTPICRRRTTRCRTCSSGRPPRHRQSTLTRPRPAALLGNSSPSRRSGSFPDSATLWSSVGC